MIPQVSSLAELRRRAEAELTQDILPFWTRHAFEPDGRLVGVVAHDLRKFDDAPRHVVLCARMLWTFAAAHRVVPNPQYLEMGRKALALLTGPFWDARHGGVFWSLDAKHQVASDRKQIYAEAFTIYGLSEWFAATGDHAALDLAKEVFFLIEKHASEPVHGGYIEALARDWSPLADMRLSLKDLNAPKSMNTLLHIMEAYTALLRVWPDATLRERLRELVEILFKHVYTTEPYARCALFFDLDWRSHTPGISYGHDIEASWLFWEAADALGDETLKTRTRDIALAMAEGVRAHGLDTDGAVLYAGEGQQVLNPEKHWWPQAEAVVGFLNAYQLGKHDADLRAAFRAWDFIEAKVIDRQHGEWFAILRRDGTPLPDYPENTDSCKIGPWKCPYHNARACIEVLRRVPAAK
ncbi:MAG TPA: AGE family epimerase/isomerase [Opitutaceae bacterium]|nr:AGE family epimerase/isomerase [Opitutaceae bacterium]HPG16837.1 AGE family epimerase/isomerase [Opitutaceae bacterium]HPO00932.1 AGE family epimerase/isomerase [Opitutaceae bacterium]